MVRAWFLPALAGLVLASTASAQAPPWRFRWQAGQVLTYRVEHATSVAEVVGDSKEETKTQLRLTKRWQVEGVDPAGVATVTLSLTALRSETTRPNGEVLLYDSADPEKSTPELRESMAGFVGKPLAVLRVDRTGKVVEVKESKHGPASRYEASPPFALTVPDAPVKAGQYWERAYAVTLEPPQGTGEKYQAVQRYVCKEVKDTGAVLELTTTLKTQPEAVADRLPLLQSLPEGEVIFDPQTGTLRSAKLRIEKELKNHQGEGSSYRFQSVYTEEYVGNK